MHSGNAPKHMNVKHSIARVAEEGWVTFSQYGRLVAPAAAVLLG